MTVWQLRRTPQAEDDLVDIWSYIAGDDPAAADRTVLAILRAFERTADYPRMGRHLDGVPETYRALVSGRYLVIYQLMEAEETVWLIRVLHGARDLPTAFELN